MAAVALAQAALEARIYAADRRPVLLDSPTRRAAAPEISNRANADSFVLFHFFLSLSLLIFLILYFLFLFSPRPLYFLVYHNHFQGGFVHHFKSHYFYIRHNIIKKQTNNPFKNPIRRLFYRCFFLFYLSHYIKLPSKFKILGLNIFKRPVFG